MFHIDDLTRPLPYKARRESSYDRSGGNADSLPFAAGETKALCDLRARGEIRHIWMAVNSDDIFCLRKVILRMYWDGEETPSVETPVGDFFGLGHSHSYTYSCAAFSTSSNDSKRQGEGAALNSWIPMPFGRSARVEIFNDSNTAMTVYYYIDWREYPEDSGSEEEIFTLHASWRRENRVCEGDKYDLSGVSDPLLEKMEQGRNLTDRYNYLLLYAEGRGNFLGVNMSIDNRAGEWWGEGDDMFFIDRPDASRECGGSWPPDLHGTGSEDYFCHAWGMQHTQGLYCGEAWCEDNNFERAHNCNGKVVVYRYHIPDPVPFEKNIRVSIEHGHANDRGDDVASTAYWYQAEPHSLCSYEPLPDAEHRLPIPPRTDRRLATYMN